MKETGASFIGTIVIFPLLFLILFGAHAYFIRARQQQINHLLARELTNSVTRICSNLTVSEMENCITTQIAPFSDYLSQKHPNTQLSMALLHKDISSDTVRLIGPIPPQDFSEVTIEWLNPRSPLYDIHVEDTFKKSELLGVGEVYTGYSPIKVYQRATLAVSLRTN